MRHTVIMAARRFRLLISLVALSPFCSGQPKYHLIDAGRLQGAPSAIPTGVNNKGQMSVDCSARMAFMWDLQTGQTVIDGGAATVQPTGINESGVVVGWGGENGLQQGFTFTQAGGMTFLGTGNGFGENRAYGINDHGDVTGVQLAPPQHAGVWSPSSGWTDIGGLPPTGGAAGLAINNLGMVAGQTGMNPDRTIHSFLYTPGQGMQDLGLPQGYYYNLASSINDKGQVGGSVIRESDGQYKGYVRDLDGTHTYMDTIQGCTWSRLGGINSSGMAVGEYQTPTIDHGFVYSPEWGMVDINSLLDESANGYQMGSCHAISDNGMIAADAFIGGKQHAVLLVPVVPEPPSWLALCGLAPLVRFRGKRGDVKAL